jgi:anti-sigma factor RsiW
MTNVTPLVTCDRAREHLLAAHPRDPNPVGIEQHLQGCPSCRDLAQALGSLDAALRRAHHSEIAPDGLWDRVTRTLDAEDALAAAKMATSKKSIAGILAQRLPSIAPLWQRAAVGLVAITLVIAAPIIIDPFALRREHPVNALVREPINDLITYRVSHRPLDFESGDPRTISDWWADKLDFHAPAPVAEIDGYRLVGGRLCYFLNRRLSALMYRKDDHVVSLYVMSSEQLELPDGGYERIGDWKISVHEHKGYTSLIWQEGSLAFALVSELSRKDLLRAATDLRRSWGQSRDTRVLRARAVAMVNDRIVTGHAERGAQCACMWR